MSISNIIVPHELREGTKILFVGEAPGEDEEKEGRLFVGKAGQLLERYLGRVGIQRRDASFANLCPRRPQNNQFERHLLNSPELTTGLQELADVINQLKPNIIVALGNWPMFFLTGCQGKEMGSGISLWRGSIVPCHFRGLENYKVLVTYHPSFIVRPEGFGNHPIFMQDLKKVKPESLFPEIRDPIYEAYIDPPNMFELGEEMAEAEWLSVDIETFGASLACVGFSDSIDRGMCLTFENPRSFQLAEEILAGPAKKIFQFGAFDINYLADYYKIKTNNYAFDTFIAAANLEPEFKRGLDFLTSVYTNFRFYKEERKIWKETGNLRTLWEYNIKDCIATYIIAMQQMEELELLYGRKVA